MKVEVAVLGSPFPNSPHGLCGRKVTLNSNSSILLTKRIGHVVMSSAHSSDFGHGLRQTHNYYRIFTTDVE